MPESDFSFGDFGPDASDPGNVRLSNARLKKLYPKYFSFLAPKKIPGNYTRSQRIASIGEHLANGDSRTAVVVSTKPFLVAAYTDELDCIAMLKFPARALKSRSLETGSRLLTINTYYDFDHVVSDLIAGPRDTGNYQNFKPVIADLFSDDVAKIAKRKTEIDRREWQRTTELAEQYRKTRPQYIRDGCPFCSHLPGTPPGLLKQPVATGGKPVFEMTDMARKALMKFLGERGMNENDHMLILSLTSEHPEVFERGLRLGDKSELGDLDAHFILPVKGIQVAIPRNAVHAFDRVLLGYDPRRGGFRFQPD